MTTDSERARNFTFSLNDLEVKDQDYVKVNFKFLMGISHFLPRSRKEQIDLTMTLKSML